MNWRVFLAALAGARLQRSGYSALGTGGIARVSLFQFLQPISGIILVWLILAEGISLIFMLASSIIMVGVILAFRAK